MAVIASGSVSAPGGMAEFFRLAWLPVAFVAAFYVCLRCRSNMESLIWFITTVTLGIGLAIDPELEFLRMAVLVAVVAAVGMFLAHWTEGIQDED
jgi:hypothetical protein